MIAKYNSEIRSGKARLNIISLITASTLGFCAKAGGYRDYMEQQTIEMVIRRYIKILFKIGCIIFFGLKTRDKNFMNISIKIYKKLLII